jgi:hypothetical protein
MRNRVERLRVWLLGSAVFLVVVIAAFVGYARFLRHLRHLKIPANLGVNIVRESGGWTLSRAAGSRTLYTIHAAKWEQHTNGKVALHDVSIQLYGKDGTRRDRIYGDEFEYDQSSGVVRALGVVHIDLQAGDVAGKPAAPANAGGADAKVLHVTTSSLVYMEKLGVAATSEYIEFQGGAMTGNATGAALRGEDERDGGRAAGGVNGCIGEFRQSQPGGVFDACDVRLRGADGGGGPGNAAHKAGWVAGAGGGAGKCDGGGKGRDRDGPAGGRGDESGGAAGEGGATWRGEVCGG